MTSFRPESHFNFDRHMFQSVWGHAMHHRFTRSFSALISAGFLVSALSFVAAAQSQEKPKPLGIFEDHGDVGTVLHAGSARYDSSTGAYTVSGSGDNMWFGTDDFHFVWKKVSGDVAITADISFVGSRGNDHRKAVLMIRQSLDGDSAAVDIARHGDGLTSLQFRDATGADDHEVQSNVSAPERVRLEKRGDRFYAFVSGKDGQLEPAGASTELALRDPFYVGIGVSAHDKDDLQTAIFSNLKVEQLAPAADAKLVLYSTLETVAAASTDRRVSYVAPTHFEAPNWSRDGTYFVFNQDGGLYRLSVNGGVPERIPTGSAMKCNNDHGISPDGTMLAISDSTQTGNSMVYTEPIAGGTPRQITMTGPSYWHGWSPDGATLAFTGLRGDNFDIYRFPPAAETKKDSPRLQALTMARSIRPMEHGFTSTRSAPALCRFGGCIRTAAARSKFFRIRRTTGFRTSRRTENRWSFSLTQAASRATLQTRTSR